MVLSLMRCHGMPSLPGIYSCSCCYVANLQKETIKDLQGCHT
jgi:hypothetical protein